MRIAILTLAMLASTPATAIQVQEQPQQVELDPENSPETLGAIVSRKPVNARLPWKATGNRRTLKVDYDGDGTKDTARMVANGRHTAVLVTSGRTGKVSTAWLIDDRNGLAPDAYLEASDRGAIIVIFPESTMVTLFLKDGRPMATYMNG